MPGGSSSGQILIPASLAALLSKGQSLKLVLVFQCDDAAALTYTPRTFQQSS